VSGIASLARRHTLEIAWAAFSALNVFVMLLWPRWETIPFHFVWVSMTLLYGLRVWSVRSTSLALAAVMIVTGAVIVRDTVEFAENADEIAEVPLMAAMFVAMVWHARRHRAAVTEVQRLADRDRATHDNERAFVRNASHELRTPIAVARGHAELAARQQTDDQAADDIAIVIDELDRLAELSGRLLLLAAADAPGFLSFRTVDVAALVEAVGHRWMGTADRDWHVHSTGPVLAAVDAERVESMLDAIIENAVDFTEPSDRIALSVATAPGEVLVEVSDTGTGIPSADLDRIFEPFTRVGTRDKRVGGTGLGLTTVRAIVRAHNGSVGIASVVGEGTTVTIRLPVRQPDGGSEAIAATPAPLLAGAGAKA